MIYPSFKDIFKSSLDDACNTYKYHLNREVEDYLIRLCVDDLLATSTRKPNNMFDSLIILGELPSSREALEYLKINGDYCLSMAGYIPESFCKKISDLDYQLLIGRYSYYRLHQKLPKDNLYKTLSYDYTQIIYILNETFDSIRVYSNSQLLEIWSAWKSTHHPIFRKKLVRMGMNPDEISC